MQSLSAIENFLGFQSTREHNASILPKCLGDGRSHIRCKDTARREKIQIYLQFSEPQRIFILQSKINVVKVSIPSNKYPIKKRHPTRRMSLYLLKRSSSHPQHDISIYMQFAANLTPYLQGRFTLSREVFAHSRRTDTEQLG